MQTTDVRTAKLGARYVGAMRYTWLAYLHDEHSIFDCIDAL